MLERPVEKMVMVSETLAEAPVVQFERLCKPVDESVTSAGKKDARYVIPEFLTGALRAMVGTLPVTVNERAVLPRRQYWKPALGRIGTFELSADPRAFLVQRARVEL